MNKIEILSPALSFLGSLLGGGVVATVIASIRTNKSEKRSRRIGCLEAQIQHLYGPLRFFSLQNMKCFEQNQKLIEAVYLAYPQDVQESPDPDIEHKLDLEFAKISRTSNEYIELVKNNNDNILKIITNNYSYIEPDDVELFGDVVLDYNRHKIEGNKPAPLRLSLAVSQHLGDILFMRPEFNTRIKERFETKKKELNSYIN